MTILLVLAGVAIGVIGTLAWMVIAGSRKRLDKRRLSRTLLIGLIVLLSCAFASVANKSIGVFQAKLIPSRHRNIVEENESALDSAIVLISSFSGASQSNSEPCNNPSGHSGDRCGDKVTFVEYEGADHRIIEHLAAIGLGLCFGSGLLWFFLYLAK